MKIKATEYSFAKCSKYLTHPGNGFNEKNRLHVGHFVHANMLLDNVVQINYKVNWPLKI